MNIYQTPIDSVNNCDNPTLIATSIDQFLSMLNDDMVDVENNYFTTHYKTSVLSNGELLNTKTG